MKTHPVRRIDKEKTKERFILLGLVSFFVLVFLGMFGFLLMDMIKQF